MIVPSLKVIALNLCRN